MPTFATPEPITVTLEIGVGDISVVAADRRDTVVAVRPTDPGNPSDVAAAERTRVEYANGTLQVRAHKGWRQYNPRGGAESIDVHIQLPTASHVRGDAGVAALRCTGRLGDCRYRAGGGDIDLDEVARADLRTGTGAIAIRLVAGDAHVSSGAGPVRIGAIHGAATVKASSGDTWIGTVGGDLRVSAADGTIVVDRAGATVAARTASGDVRIGEVTRGAIVASTAMGRLDIGVLDGVAAWLDLNTVFGNVRNELGDAERPAPGEDTVEVRGRTAYGDIVIHRAVAHTTGGAA